MQWEESIATFLLSPVGGAPHRLLDTKNEFWTAVASVGSEMAALGEKARAAKKLLSDAEASSRWLDVLENKNRTVPVATDLSGLENDFATAELALKAQLPAKLLKQYEAASQYVEFRDDHIPEFPLSQAQRWVALRAVELGWSKAKHGDIERSRGGGWDRHDHSIERIGKKYQWIACWQLIGYLSDHHWYLDWNQKPSIFDRVDVFDPLDIDTSFLMTEGNELLEGGLPALSLPSTNFQSTGTEEDLAWTRTLDDLPHLPSLVEGVDAGSSTWWNAKAYGRDDGYMDKLQSTNSMRTGQRWVELIVVPTENVPELYSKIKETDIAGSDLFNRHNSLQKLVGEHTFELIRAESAAIVTSEYEGVQFGRLTASINPARGEYDRAGTSGSFAVPENWLVKQLNLRPKGPDSMAFVTPANEVAFLDMRFPGEWDGAVVINADFLLPALEANGLTAVWIFGAEKDRRYWPRA